jgi:signal transduction histidine kinase
VGIGIQKKELKKIFQRFYRIETTNKDTYSCFGIRLYLSQETIKRHQGRVTLNSETGEGSGFIFEIPCIK